MSTPHAWLATAPLGLLLLIATAARGVETQRPQEIAIWPESVLPRLEKPERTEDRATNSAAPNRVVTSVSIPTITMYLLPAARRPTPAVIICPGGGYGRLAIDKEGHDIARWLNQIGVAGIVLKYRLPRPELTNKSMPWPMKDASRAMRMVRAQATAWNLDPTRIGIMGFSAGGHLASTLGTHFDPGASGSKDVIERASSRPDFMILVYPVITMSDPFRHPGSRTALLGEEPDEHLIDLYSNEKHVDSQTPPVFLVHARDDHTAKLPNSLQFEKALKAAGVPCFAYVFDKGGHGFGLGGQSSEAGQWPKLCEGWMRQMKLIPEARQD